MLNGVPVTVGTVTFCNAEATYCEDAAIIGTAQLTSAGTAVIKLVPGIGNHSYKAVFAGTTNPAIPGGSPSTPQSLTVTGVYPTTTTISSSGTAGDYTLTGTVVGTGSVSLAPTGSVSFADASNANYLLGSALLGPATLNMTFAAKGAPLTVTSEYAVYVVAGDFNNDGISDLAVAGGQNSTALYIFLGNGDGTFQAPTPYTLGNQPFAIAVGDFNADGNLDLAVVNLIS